MGYTNRGESCPCGSARSSSIEPHAIFWRSRSVADVPERCAAEGRSGAEARGSRAHILLRPRSHVCRGTSCARPTIRVDCVSSTHWHFVIWTWSARRRWSYCGWVLLHQERMPVLSGWRDSGNFRERRAPRIEEARNRVLIEVDVRSAAGESSLRAGLSRSCLEHGNCGVAHGSNRGLAPQG